MNISNYLSIDAHTQLHKLSAETESRIILTFKKMVLTVKNGLELFIMDFYGTKCISLLNLYMYFCFFIKDPLMFYTHIFSYIYQNIWFILVYISDVEQTRK